MRTGLALVWGRRRLRVALLALAVALPLAGGGWLWLRHSPLVSVRHVRIGGVHGPEARAVDAALVSAAKRMSTLDVHPGALLAAVAPLRVVRDVRVFPSLPHGLRIEVTEQLPVAALTIVFPGGTQVGEPTAVAADGVVLGPALLSGSLPTVTSSFQPTTGGRARGAGLLSALAVLGAAPRSLAKLIARVYTGPKGLTVAMRSGLLAYFGDATRPHAKWLSLARVLADPSSAGASYVDVRLPARPAAGFPAGVQPPAASEEAATGEAASGSESPVAALAAGLTANSGEGAGATGEASSGASSTGAPSTAPSQAAPGSSGETAAGGEAEQAPVETPSGG
jgi:cell division protein FtsQ